MDIFAPLLFWEKGKRIGVEKGIAFCCCFFFPFWACGGCDCNAVMAMTMDGAAWVSRLTLLAMLSCTWMH